MDLPIALKSLLATLTTKTTAAATDGVMLCDLTPNSANNPAPNGKMTMASLADVMAGNGKTDGFLKTVSVSTLNGNANNAQAGTVICLATNTGVQNLPSYAEYEQSMLLTIGWSDIRILQINILLTKGVYARFLMNQAWTEWTLTSTPDYLRPYAGLAALATGIMGQTISSITAAYFQGTIAQAVFDNVFIAVTRLSDTYPLAVKPKDWASYSSASAYHVDGVLLVSSDKHLVIAPSEASLSWGADSDSHAASGNTPTSDRDTAMATFDGKSRTNTAVQVSEYADVTTACGYCHAFTTVTDAYDTTKTAYARRKAGMWWLPSLGEMMMIWSNMTKINQVMSLIGGTPLAETAYWTSTENSQNYAWYLYLSNGNVGNYNKKPTPHVRPVAAF